MKKLASESSFGPFSKQDVLTLYEVMASNEVSLSLDRFVRHIYYITTSRTEIIVTPPYSTRAMCLTYPAGSVLNSIQHDVTTSHRTVMVRHSDYALVILAGATHSMSQYTHVRRTLELPLTHSTIAEL